jgi:hypothetical protein
MCGSSPEAHEVTPSCSWLLTSRQLTDVASRQVAVTPTAGHQLPIYTFQRKQNVEQKQHFIATSEISRVTRSTSWRIPCSSFLSSRSNIHLEAPSHFTIIMTPASVSLGIDALCERWRRPKFRPQCTHITMSRLYGHDLICDYCRRPGQFGWVYRCSQDREDVIEFALSQGYPVLSPSM